MLKYQPNFTDYVAPLQSAFRDPLLPVIIQTKLLGSFNYLS